MAAAATLLLPAGLAAQDAGPAAAGVTFFTGPNFTGSSKTLTLAPDQPYAAIPYIGDELNERIASLRADPQIGVILFQRPHFASRDDSCGPNLGTAEDPDAWWLGLTADFEPPAATTSATRGRAHEAAETLDDDYSSVIAYRRDLGPPPGFLLLERRSYYNRGCARSADQSYFNRLFVPVPNPPQRGACTDLSVPAGAHGAGSDAPTFARISEAYALLPEAFSRGYGAIEHRFTLTLFNGPGCSGASLTLPSAKNGRPAGYRLSEFDFDRSVRSVAIRYQRGPLDPYLGEAATPAEATLTAPAPMPAPAPAPAPAPTQSPSVGAAPAAPAPAAPAPTAPTQAQPAHAPAPQQPMASPPPAGGGLQPAPPSAPPQSQEALQPAPEPQLAPVPAPAPAPAPSRPAGPQEETYRFPVHQVYRLNYCLDGEQGCGEPAATAWCKAQGFDRAVRWTQEDNIGALYPTVFIGSGNLCDKFLCDGFEEITCAR